MFFSSLKKQVEDARKELHERLKNVRDLLSQKDLDDSLRKELEETERRILEHLQTRISKINGGS